MPAGVFVFTFAVNFLMHEFPELPDRFRYGPDALLAFVGAVVAARLIVTRRFTSIPIGYWVVSLGFTYVVICAAVVNDVSPEATFGGFRFFYKYVPLFLLPFAYNYTETDVKRLFMLVMGMTILQIPVALRQRFQEYAVDNLSGDVVTGSLSVSGSLSLLSVGTIAMVVAFYLSRRIGGRAAVVLCMLFLIPATLNETKVTPVALLVGAAAVAFARRSRLGVRQLAAVVLGGCMLLGVFVTVYDQLYKAPGTSEGLVDFMTDRQQVLDGYTFRGVEAKSNALRTDHPELVARQTRLTEQQTWIGRFDSVVAAGTVLSHSGGIPMLVGLGIGNVSSRFGEGGSFVYLTEELNATQSTISQVMWETGLLGVAFLIALVLLVVRDSYQVSRTQGFWGAVGAGCFGVGLMAAATLVYLNFLFAQELTCLFAFFFGVAVSRKALRARHPDSRRLPAPELRAHSNVVGREREA